MSVVDTTNDANVGRKSGGVLIFLPLLIALLGTAAIVLAGMPETKAASYSGYGIDERTQANAIGIVGPLADIR
jgi:hypothetical protein